MPELDDEVGLVVVEAFLCFLWVDFIEPLASEPVVPEFMEPLVPEFIEPLVPEFIEPLLPEFIEPLEPEFIEPWFMELLSVPLESVVWVCEPALDAGVGDDDCEAFWAMTAPLMAIQPASIETISFVLRMTNLLELVAPWGRIAMFGAMTSLTG